MIKRFINVYNIDKEKRENERKAMNEQIYNLKNNDDNNNDNDIFLHMGITSNINENNDNLEKKNDFCCLNENKQNNKNDGYSDKKEIDKNIKVEEQLKKKANEQKVKMKKKRSFI